VRNRPDLGRDMYGVRAALAVTPAPKWFASMGLAYQLSSTARPMRCCRRCARTTIAFDATVGYSFTRKLSLRGELIVTENKSSFSSVNTAATSMA
jgi:hypothetical protein